MKLLVVAALHGNFGWFKYMVLTKARDEKADAIVQLGDLGWGPWPYENRQMQDRVADKLRHAGIPMFFIDGNHDNFDNLEKAVAAGRKTDEGFVEVRPNLFYIPRGTAWQWGEKKFIGLGGARSIDIDPVPPEWPGRTLGKTYWEQELITQQQVNDILDRDLSADVMFSHDAPAGLKWDAPFSKKSDAISQWNRKAVRAVAEHVGAKVLVHGHYHQRYTERLVLDNGRPLLVCGLDRDKYPGNWEVMTV